MLLLCCCPTACLVQKIKDLETGLESEHLNRKWIKESALMTKGGAGGRVEAAGLARWQARGLNIEVLCAATPEALAHSPSQMPLSCPVAPLSQREMHKDGGGGGGGVAMRARAARAPKPMSCATSCGTPSATPSATAPRPWR